MLPALGEAIGAMSEPMVSHDAVAFYLLSQEVSRHVKVVQSGQGADEVFAGYHWYPPMQAVTDEVGTADRERLVAAAVQRYAEAFFDRPHEEMAQVLAPAYRVDADVSRALVEEHFRMPGCADGHRHGAASGLPDHAGRRPRQAGRQHDDGVRPRGTGAVPGPRGARRRGAHPAGAQARPRRQGRAQGGGTAHPARRGDRPAQGLLPRPGTQAPRGPLPRAGARRLQAPEARERGLFRDEYVQALLAEPNASLTPLRGNKLWQLGLLELWLQRHGVGP
jgi:asparagine synthase (glutamine-hydrolysing)